MVSTCSVVDLVTAAEWPDLDTFGSIDSSPRILDLEVKLQRNRRGLDLLQVEIAGLPDVSGVDPGHQLPQDEILYLRKRNLNDVSGLKSRRIRRREKLA